MAGDDRTAEERERDAEIGRRLQEELPGYRARFEPDPDQGRNRHDDEEKADEAPAALVRPRYQEGGCLDPGCLPWWIVVPGAAIYGIARGVIWLLAAGRRRLVHRRDERRRARGWTPRVSTAAQIGAPLRSPSGWADAQRDFRSAYDADPASLARRPVAVTWNAAPAAPAAADLGALVANLRSPIGQRGGALVTIALRDGSGRRMAFEATPDSTAVPMRGKVDGVLVGEVGTNAAACVEVAGGVLWPAYNPVGR